MDNLSVVISVLNGEKFLGDCLTSVKNFASEIIVVDHGSTDKTVSIAKKFTKKIYQQKNNPESIDIQKNYGFEKATQKWILSLDADEKVTNELREEISHVLSTHSAITGYRIPRKNIIFNKWIEHAGWYPDYQLRLFQKGKGKYTKKHVHEEILVDGQVESLVLPIIHENYQTIHQFLQRHITLYAPNEATSLIESGYSFSYADVIKFPLKEFLSRYFAREGYKDGFHGLVISLLMAVYHFVIFLYLWEKNNFTDSVDASKQLVSQLHKSREEIRYWTTEIKLENTKSPAIKLLLKTKRKLGL